MKQVMMSLSTRFSEEPGKPWELHTSVPLKALQVSKLPTIDDSIKQMPVGSIDGDCESDIDDDSVASCDTMGSLSEEQETIVHRCKLASCYADVEGLQEICGRANIGDRLSLVREPKKPGNPNSICVRNFQGEKVGYIVRYQAMKIAPLMDAFRWREGRFPEWGLSVEGTVARDKENTNENTILLDFYVSGRAPSMEELLEGSQTLNESLKNTLGCSSKFRAFIKNTRKRNISPRPFHSFRNQVVR